ncbi:MAG: hypothetical protein GY822_13830 [Deltaproteobacteria bacterium]|nr:hypothetical protein [Deltaproteobacteria bacterium]
MLNAKNEALHAELDERFLTMMEDLTALAFKAAYTKWQRLIGQVKGHMAYEEDVLLPLFLEKKLDETTGLELGKTGQLVHGDHVILLRTENAIEEAFHTLLPLEKEPSGRRNMLHQLDTFMRWARVMEHHTDRETHTFYSLFDKDLPESELQHHVGKLQSATAGDNT